MTYHSLPDGCGLFLHSCESMPELVDDSIVLTVTSPPYWNAIDYEQHQSDSNQWYRTRKGGPYEEYLELMERIFREVLRVTRPGGFCAIIIGTVLHQKKHYPVPMDFTARLCGLGWDFYQDIVWHKVTGGVKRARVTIQHPYPGYFYPNLMTESILIFQKPGGMPLYKNRSREDLEDNRYPIDDLFKREIANNIWHIAPVPPGFMDHPCPFPEEIPYRLIQLYSYQGDTVLDPFMGTGTTPKVAHSLNRKFFGYELSEKYYLAAGQRINEPLRLRKEQLTAKFVKIAHSILTDKATVPIVEQEDLF